MSQIITMNLPGSIGLSIIQGIFHMTVRTPFRFLRYQRTIEEPSYVWISQNACFIPLLASDLQIAAGQMEGALTPACRPGEHPWIMQLYAQDRKQALIGGTIPEGFDIAYRTEHGIFVLSHVAKGEQPKSA